MAERSEQLPRSGRDFLIFESQSGARYLYDAYTASVHPWPWAITARQIERMYRTADGDLPAFFETAGLPAVLCTYVLNWRRSAAAFGPAFSGTHCQCEAHSGGGRDAKGTRRPPPWRPTPDALSNLMLVLTDACNLRCTYCIFSGLYPGFKGLRSSRMTWDTARGAIDRFLDLNRKEPFRSLPDRTLDIAFFGGEPLLEPDLIRKAVVHAESRQETHYRLRLSITTNMAHLTDEAAAFLVEHRIGLQCSIDGPSAVHDQFRVDAAGRGTFSRIRDNLRKLRDLDPVYFATRVRALVTLNGHSDLVAINDFFESCDPLVPQVAFVGYVREGGFHEKHRFDAERFTIQYRHLWEIYLERKRTGVALTEGTFLYRFFEEALRQLHERLMWVGSPRRGSYTATCQPGRRIAVSTDGKFHMCERINESFPIGDVASGLDLERCAAVLASYYCALPDCDRCWARSLCTSCCAQVCDGEQFVFRPQHCNRIRQTLAEGLSALYSLLEAAPGALACGEALIDSHSLAEPLQ